MSKKSLIINLSIILVVTGLSVYFLVTKNVINAETVKYLSFVSIFAVFAFKYLSLFGESLVNYLTVKNSLSGWTLFRSFSERLYGNLGSDVSPFKSAHYPLRLYYYAKKNYGFFQSLSALTKCQILASFSSVINYAILSLVSGILGYTVTVQGTTVGLFAIVLIGLGFHALTLTLCLMLAFIKPFQTFMISLVALSSIIFAPGNIVRVDDAVEKGTSLFIKVIDLIYYDYYSKVSASFVFVLSALCALRFFRFGKKVLSMLSALNGVILLICFDYGLVTTSFLFVIISILLSLVTIIPTLISSFKKVGMVPLLSLAIIGGGSQLMLLASQLWGFRTSMSWILIYIICILVILNNDYSTEKTGIYSCILCMAVNPYLGIVGIAISIILTLRKRSMKAVECLLLLVAIIAGLGDEVLGYYENRDIHTNNIKMVEYANKNDISTITILPYDDQQYGWTSPPLSEFHEKYFRSYYGIPDDVSIGYAAGE